MTAWYVYIVRCSDTTFYTGITKDLQRRVDEHNHSNVLGASYTRNRRPVKLVYHESKTTRSDAVKRENEIKRMTRKQKECLMM